MGCPRRWGSHRPWRCSGRDWMWHPVLWSGWPRWCWLTLNSITSKIFSNLIDSCDSAKRSLAGERELMQGDFAKSVFIRAHIITVLAPCGKGEGARGSREELWQPRRRAAHAERCSPAALSVRASGVSLCQTTARAGADPAVGQAPPRQALLSFCLH